MLLDVVCHIVSVACVHNRWLVPLANVAVVLQDCSDDMVILDHQSPVASTWAGRARTRPVAPSYIERDFGGDRS